MDKEKERREFDLFRSLYRDCPTGEIAERETPDFSICTNDNRFIGIELKDCDIPDQQERESVRSNVVASALQMNTAQHGPELWVDVWFENYVRLSSRDRTRVANGLVATINSVVHSPFPFKTEIDEENELLPREINKISACGCPDGFGPKWQPGRADWPSGVAPEHLQQVIEKKRKMAGVAAAEFKNDLWLVIVNPFAGAVHQFLDDRTARVKYDAHHFTKVFWLDVTGPRLIELQVSSDNDPA